MDEGNVPQATVGPAGTGQAPMQPHRGVLILVLGILGIVCCFILGIVAWVLGNNDLKEMAAGRMDPSGQGLTQAGKICGMIAIILQIIGFILWLLFAVIFAGTAATTFHEMPIQGM